MKHAVVIVLLLGAALPAWSEVELFVSPKGEDSSAGSRGAPMKTIAAALAKAEPGTTVTLLEGTYQEAVTLKRSGEAGAPVALKGEGHVTIDLKANKESRHAITGRGVGYVVIEGVEVTGFVQGLKFKDCHHIEVRKCRAHDGVAGLSIEGSKASQMLFEDVELADNEAGGADVSDGVAMEDVTFRRCSAHDNGCKGGTDGFGISHGCTTRNVRFENCTAYRNGSDGFDISGKKGFSVTLFDCVSHHNGTKMWGANFKCWNPGSRFINCIGYVTGKEHDGTFEALAEDLSCINCTSGENGDCGMKVGGKNIRLVNCLFTGAKKKAVWVKNPDAALTAENSLVAGCEPGDIGRNAIMTENPLFLDPGKWDYRIQPGSAAAGKGKPQPEAPQDAEGHPRPKDAPAVGAYEPFPTQPI
jgi:hypothetical protein